MGKFRKHLNKQNSSNGGLNHALLDDNQADDVINWQNLLVDYQNLSVQDALKNIIDKICSSENVQFDQMCLILKHYLLLDNQDYLEHFLKNEQATFVNQLVDLFTRNNAKPNAQWMITELFKLVSSICNKQQAMHLLCSQQFQKLLLVDLFDLSLLHSLTAQVDLNFAQTCVLSNLFETITNLCEMQKDLLIHVNRTHIDWMIQALLSVTFPTRYLCLSIARLLHLISENLTANSNLSVVLFDLCIGKNLFEEFLAKLTTSNQESVEFALCNLSIALNLITLIVNVALQNNQIESELKMAKEEFLLNVLKKFSLVIEQALNIHLKEGSFGQIEANNDLNNNKKEEDTNEKVKAVLKLTELAVECKLQAIDLVRVVNEFFIQDQTEMDGDEEIQDEESWDECDQAEETTQNEVDMEMDQHGVLNHPISNQASASLVQSELKRLTLVLLKTISEDDHFSLSQVEHVYKSVRLVRNEAVDVYTQVMQNVSKKDNQTQQTSAEQDIFFKHLCVILDSIANFQTQTGLNDAENTENDLEEQAFAVKLSQLAHDLFINFREKLGKEQILTIIEKIKQILFKYKLNYAELSVLLAKVLSLIGIKLRNECFTETKEAISICGNILLELVSASLNSNQLLERLRLSAEFLDMLIDLFGEDNMSDLEVSLNFIQRMSSFSDAFYANVKQLGKKQKLNKYHGAVIMTVRDNLKHFIDYKIKHSK